MRITRTEHGWSIDVPADVVAGLQLHDGEDVDVDIRRRPAPLSEAERQVMVSKIKSLKGMFPADFKFDREEANARR